MIGSFVLIIRRVVVVVLAGRSVGWLAQRRRRQEVTHRKSRRLSSSLALADSNSKLMSAKHQPRAQRRGKRLFERPLNKNADCDERNFCSKPKRRRPTGCRIESAMVCAARETVAWAPPSSPPAPVDTLRAYQSRARGAATISRRFSAPAADIDAASSGWRRALESARMVARAFLTGCTPTMVVRLDRRICAPA